MTIEYEAKVLDINPNIISQKIMGLGGKQIGQFFMRRYVYDVVPGDKSKWIRLRDTGQEVTLTVKEIVHDGIDGTQEVEIVVDDFEVTHQLLEKLGFTAKSYQENRRTSFLLDGARLEIDQWPMIQPYLEIEADSREQVVEVAARLGFGEVQLTGENTIKIYARAGIDLNSIKELRFSESV
ncbi:class IV adenylate cyclase [Lihuaxuella thermophila]|uniref:Adenylate cyclase, class 2 n=1 Tax=Lihuaxuella thermophila TaxID=1173111 RepID=A0A1H8ASA1_9BACL|nr:CYTH domain-containing protein [Lihuaxuella thermophila]SEM73443.1 adenylate cyclase, class 2 [Lihuaxuella thermophila]